MKPLSLAHVLYSFGVGGQERVVLDLAGAQRALGHDISAIALSEETEHGLGAELRSRGARVVSMPKRGGFDPSLYPRLAALFRRLEIDLVHTHNPMPLVYAALAGKLARARVVHTKHGEHRDRPRRMALRRFGARFVDAYVAVSETTAEFARKHAECANSKLSVIPNGTDLARFGRDSTARRRVRDELGIPMNAWVALNVGRFVPEKNHELLLRAASPILGAQCRLVIAGGGRLGPQLLRVASSLPGGEFAHLLGQRDDVPALLAAADAFVLSSRTEGLPIVLIEALASEIPVVSTAVGGIPRVIDDSVSGLLVPPDDAEALGAALVRLRDDAALAARIADAGRQLALSRFTAERMHEDYMALYRRVLEERSSWKTRFARS